MRPPLPMLSPGPVRLIARSSAVSPARRALLFVIGAALISGAAIVWLGWWGALVLLIAAVALIVYWTVLESRAHNRRLEAMQRAADRKFRLHSNDGE